MNILEKLIIKYKPIGPSVKYFSIIFLTVFVALVILSVKILEHGVAVIVASTIFQFFLFMIIMIIKKLPDNLRGSFNKNLALLLFFFSGVTFVIAITFWQLGATTTIVHIMLSILFLVFSLFTLVLGWYSINRTELKCRTPIWHFK